MLKKLFAVLAAVAVICSAFTACSVPNFAALEVGGAKIDSEIYTYYLDRIMSSPANYGLTDTCEQSEFADKAVELCANYVAVNTMFAANSLALSAADKTNISHTVNNLWIRYSNHYTSIGVSRQTVSKAETAKAYKAKLFTHFYDKGRGDPAAESEILTYYYKNYVLFTAVCAYFTAEDGITPMTQLQKQELIDTFGKLTDAYGSTGDFAQAATKFGFTASESSLLKSGESGYPAGFFEDIAELADGSAAVLIYDDCIFAVLRESLQEKGESFYSEYRSECLDELYSSEAQADIDREVAKYEIKRHNAIIGRITAKLCDS